jgi:ppGpp synthetase/RelA/SpoT-type nucleotidyltranferase
MTLKSDTSNELENTWNEKPEIILSFIKSRPQYEQLCSEVAYILSKRMEEQNVEYSTITSRAKTLNSFSEKISRKDYKNPLIDITDLAGVRVVYLYKNDRSTIEQIIESEFKILEKIDKVEEQEVDKFGYGALHYLVNLGRKSSGARYDDLKGLVCEIQVRTVLQDAWAIVDHHLVYKNESDIPKVLRRKINSLSGLFETADDQFDQVRSDREKYRESVNSKKENKKEFLGQEINLETFTEYLKWKFPNQKLWEVESSVPYALENLLATGYKTLKDLEETLKRTESARNAIRAEVGGALAISEINRAVALKHPTYEKTLSGRLHKIVEKNLKLVT